MIHMVFKENEGLNYNVDKTKGHNHQVKFPGFKGTSDINLHQLW